LTLFRPNGLSAGASLGLIGFSFVTSFITAAFSLGGGVLMLTLMVILLPGAAIVPVHGLVQLGSNTGRAVIQRAHVDWSIAKWMALGAIPGALIGGPFTSLLPEQAFGVAIAVFILTTTWIKLPGVLIRAPLAWVGVGTVIGALGMLLSATGPLTGVFLRHLPDRQNLVATHATVMVAQHLAKIIVFTGLGFALGAWLPLAAAMILSGLGGTWAGSHFLNRMPEQAFRLGFRILLTILALDLLRRAFI